MNWQVLLLQTESLVCVSEAKCNLAIFSGTIDNHTLMQGSTSMQC